MTQVFPIIIAPLLPDADSTATPQEMISMYRDVMTTFGGLSSMGILATLLLWVADYNAGGWLNASAEMLALHEVEKARQENQDRLGQGTPSAYVAHVHSRNKYLTRLGIRPHGGPRLVPETTTDDVSDWIRQLRGKNLCLL